MTLCGVICGLTKHVDYLSSAVIYGANTLIVQPPHGGPPDVALARPPDDDDHVGVEVNEETDGQEEEEDKG